MIRISDVKIELGQRIILPEKWHEKAESFGKCQNLSYEFVVEEIRKERRNTYYICSPVEKGTKKKKMAFSEYTIKYLLATEVPETNIGFSFKEFLPLENTRLLVTNIKNPNEIIPGIMIMEMAIIPEDLITFTFKVSNLNGEGFADVNYYGNIRKATWKFLHGDTAYMSDYEKMYQDTYIHKDFVIKSSEKLARYLESEGAIEHAKALRERAIVHDNSKINCEDEMHALSRIINDKTSLKDATKQLSPIKKDSIQLHWKHNSHHPEHFKTAIDMSKLDIMEMCCDWHARSTQYHSNFIEYVKIQQELRFHFPEWMFSEILHYCEVLDSKF